VKSGESGFLSGQLFGSASFFVLLSTFHFLQLVLRRK
jgi:hypothetical protein